MAGAWIKVRKDLFTDPAVIRMAGILDLDPADVVGRLVAVWAWADSHANCHGCVTLVSRSCLDGVTRTGGFGDAMAAVGWVSDAPGDGGGIVFPRFERHMGEGAKARALSAKRKESQRRRDGKFGHADVTLASRSRHARVTPVSQNSVTREEKRREEEKDISAGAKKPSAKQPRKPDPLFDAVAEVCAADPATAGSHVAKVRVALAAGGYTPDDVREFGRRFLELCPWAAGERVRPELGELQKHIGKLRATPPPAAAKHVLTAPAFDW